MRHLILRLELTWLTFVAIVAMTLVIGLGPRGGGLEMHFARTTPQFQDALQRAGEGDPATSPAGISMKAVNAYRAGLAADMLFLVAYGLLLRKSVRYHPPHRWSRAAEWGAVLIMLADAVENLATLAVLSAFGSSHPQPSRWLFAVMPAAAMAKWTSAGAVMFFLAARWRERVLSYGGLLRVAARTVCLGFAAGGICSLLVVLSALYPPVRTLAAAAALLGAALALALQFRFLDTFGRLLRFLILIRVPLVVLLAAAAFGPFGLGPAASLLGGILDVPTAWGIAATTAACLVLAFACGTQINMVRAYSWQRTFDPTLRVLRYRAFAAPVFWTAVAAASSLVFGMCVASADVPGWQVIRGIGGGLTIGLAFLLIVELAAALLTQPTPGATSPPQLAVPLDRIPGAGTVLRRVRQAPPPRLLVAIKAQLARLSIAGRLFGLASGYVGPNRRLLPGHSFAAVQLLVSAAFYGLLVYDKWSIVEPADPWVPTAASVVLLLLVWSWALAGVAFFLDRYRVPLFASVIGLVLVTGSCTHTDHVVTLKPGPDYTLATPGNVLSAFPRPLVAAAAGGGIQAGAWAARVLQGIHEELGAQPQAAFRDRLALVTGVSGGSMGAMFYGAYRDGIVADGTARSMWPSLDEVASAMIGPDLLRALGTPVRRGRGEALERSWASRLPRDEPVTLRAWSEKARRFAGHEALAPPFPAFLFNTTVVETGQAMAFATSQFPSRAYRDTFDRATRQSPLAESANLVFNLSNGDDTRGGPYEIEVATAARLSAAFPYVSPATTLAVPGGSPLHLVDGGYYDNYGLVVTSQWLDDALKEIAANPELTLPSTIGLVIIRSLVGVEQDLVVPLDQSNPAGPLTYTPEAKKHGWAWQITAPPAAFVNGRTFGQWAGGNQVLRLLIDKWKDRVAIRVYLFDFPAATLDPVCQIEPLSWKLTTAQKGCIESGWQNVKSKVSALTGTGS